MMRWINITITFICIIVLGIQGPVSAQQRPNVLFIALDDMNDWITLLDDDAPIRTPNLERLARRGTVFTRAYCASAACNPSRTSIMTGLRPSTTGVYGNNTDWRGALPDVATIPQHFMQNGYQAMGAGKIFHHHGGGAYHDRKSFNDFQMMPDPPDAPMPQQKRNGFAWYGSANTDWGVWPPDPNEHVDIKTANYVIDQLQQNHNKPFFLAAGIFRPHMPFFIPPGYDDEYPEHTVRMPVLLPNDVDDLAPGHRLLPNYKDYLWTGMMQAERERPGAWREAVRYYQASSTFADAQVGRILDALDASPYKDNTVVVLWSDHGYHLGEKEHWEKFALWEKTNHVPFIVVAPDIVKPGSRCTRPVSLIDLYPTLIDLCGLPEKPELDGVSLRPLLENRNAVWERPALMTYGYNNHAVRKDRWRYIRYADGSEELYDLDRDLNEWHNVAGESRFRTIMDELQQWMPEENASAAPAMGKPE
jgi:arylsulfatase A-like enzyme